jgi:hypothetical protein
MVVNGAIVTVGPMLIPAPEGIDVTNMESLAANVHLLEPKHFLFPFLAHAAGTLVGAWVAARIAASHKLRMALVVGVLSLCGGIAAAFMIPAPAWFIALDLIGAYIPMAWLGGKAAAGSIGGGGGPAPAV